jgi:hypothetical protein
MWGGKETMPPFHSKECISVSALRKMSARRAKYLSAKGLSDVVHRLSSDTCTTAVDKDMDSVLDA